MVTRSFWRNVSAHHVHPPITQTQPLFFNVCSNSKDSCQRLPLQHEDRAFCKSPQELQHGGGNTWMPKTWQWYVIIKWNKLNTMTRYAAMSAMYLFKKITKGIGMVDKSIPAETCNFGFPFSPLSSVSWICSSQISLDLLLDSTDDTMLGCNSWECAGGAMVRLHICFHQRLTYQTGLLESTMPTGSTRSTSHAWGRPLCKN